jgi:ferredoxin-NADP reductase
LLTIFFAFVPTAKTLAFHFKKPSGFSFKAGEFADVTLTDPVEADAKGNTRTFSIASPPFANELVFTTRMRNTAFKRSLKEVTLTTKVKISPAAGSFTLGLPDLLYQRDC